MGYQAQYALEEAGITVNKNTIPGEPASPFYPSGIRLGTPALTTRGMKEPEMKQIGQWIIETLKHHDNMEKLTAIKAEVKALAKDFPVPGIA